MSNEKRPAVVFTTPLLAHPPVGGPALRVENSILALARIADVHVHVRVDWHEAGGADAFRFLERHVAGCHPGSSRGRWRSTLRRAAAGRVAWSSDNGGAAVRLFRRIVRACLRVADRLLGTPDEAAEVVALARSKSARVVWFGYGNISFDVMRRVRALAPDLKLVCDTDSVWSRFVLRELEIEADPARRAEIEAEGLTKEREEREWMQFCDVTTAVSPVDAEYYESLNTAGRRVMLFRNVINLATYESPPPPAPGLAARSIFLAGSFWPKSPMEHAARWFLDRVLPRVRESCPGTVFYIAGKGSDEVLADVESLDVRVLGRVDSVLPYLCHAGVAVVPLFFESGTRFKILEAGACRVPVVSTTLGAEGIEVRHGEDILLGDTPEDFAACVVEVLSDAGLGRRLGTNLHALVARDYSLATLAGEGREILRALGETVAAPH